MAQSTAKEEDSLQSLLQRTLQGEDMQKLLSHPDLPRGDKDFTDAMRTINTKLAQNDILGPKEQAAMKVAGVGTIAHPEFDTSGSTTENSNPIPKLDENVQQALGALKLLHQQESYTKAKKDAELEAKKPTALGLILEIANRELSPVVKNITDYTTNLKDAISGVGDPLTNFRLSPRNNSTPK